MPQDKQKTLKKTIHIVTDGKNGGKFSLSLTVESAATPGPAVQLERIYHVEPYSLKGKVNVRERQQSVNSSAHAMASELMKTLASFAGADLSRMKVTEG